jgi:hypothetical protein
LLAVVSILLPAIRISSVTNGPPTMSPVTVKLPLTETFPDGGGRFAVYDRMFRMRRQAFPHIKCEQLLYYFYAFGDSAVSSMIEVAQKVEDALNNGDESAEELNAWVRDNPQEGSLPVYFHNIKIYQLQETRDIIDF